MLINTNNVENLNEGLFINTHFITDPFKEALDNLFFCVQTIRECQPYFKNCKWSKCQNYILTTNETQHAEECGFTKTLLSHYENSPSDAHSGATRCGWTGNRNANPSTFVCLSVSLSVALSAAGKAPRPTQQHPAHSGNLFQNKHNCSKSPKKRETEIQPKILTLSQRHIRPQSMWCLDVVLTLTCSSSLLEFTGKCLLLWPAKKCGGSYHTYC